MTLTLFNNVRTRAWRLRRLAEAADAVLHGASDPEVSGVQEDSRLCSPGDLFVAIPGTAEDGIGYARDAVARGAVGVAAERDPGVDVPWIEVDDARAAAGRCADLVYDDPSRRIPLIGVTGTNGKTTTAHLIAQLLPGPVGFIGTTGVFYPGADAPGVASLTTPAATAMRRHLDRMIEAGCTACIAEVSSHALHQGRVRGLHFAAAVYTNLTGDHLDYHGDMKRYAAAKALLFESLAPEAVAVLNGEQPACRRIETAARVRFYAPEEVRMAAVETRFRWRDLDVAVPLVGRHNAENAAAALETVAALGGEPRELVRLLEGVLPARGRLEPVQREPYLVLVDFAHTDDALEKSLRAVREVTTGAVTLVFGCGGDRDRSKRPRMGAVAARLADRIVLTNDNPRSERPERIAEEVAAGMGARRPQIILDRKAAIREAIAQARSGDTVLIAGKGHETYQIVGSRRLPFDDAAVAREALTDGPRAGGAP